MAPSGGSTPWWAWLGLIAIVGLIVWNVTQQNRISAAYTNHRKLYDSYAHYYWCDEPTHRDAGKCASLGNHIPPPDPPPPPN
jgi:hypothetical protein